MPAPAREKIRPNRRLFYKFLLSFVLVLLLPVGLLGYYGKLQVSDLIQYYVAQMNQDMLSQLREGTDARLMEMNQIAARIASNPNLTPYAVTQDSFSAYQTKPLLDYKIANDFLYELLYYVRGAPLLYSSVSTYRLPTFINDIYAYSNWKESDFRRDMDSITKPTLRPAEQVRFMSSSPERLISYMLPLPMGSQHPYGTLLFLIKEDSLLSHLKNDAFPRSGNTIIYDEQNRIVTFHQGERGLGEDMLKRELSPQGELFSVAELEQERYYVNRLKSELTGWTYVTVLPTELVLAPIETALFKWLRALAAILLLGFGVIIILMKINVNPVQALLASHRELGLKVERSRSAMREHLLLGLLKGEVSSQEVLQERGSEVGLSFPHSSYFVFIAEWQGARGDEKSRIMDRISGDPSGELSLYSKESVESSRIIFIGCTSFTEPRITEWLANLHVLLQEECGVKLTCGVGRPYEQLDQVGRSFIEASAAIDYKLIRGAGQLIYFPDVAADHSFRLFDSAQEREQVRYLFREGKTEQLARVLRQFETRLKQGGTTLFAARFLCYDMILTVAKTVESMRQESPELTGRFPDVMTLMEFDTVEELVQLITDSCMELCVAVEQLKGSPAQRQLDAMLTYLQEHYKDSAFSVQGLSEHLSLSTSYCSRLFKERTGLTILEHVNGMRMAEAKRLLVETDSSIKELVAAVGYYDTSSFIRKFKTAAGVTPGEYRKLARQETDRSR